TRVIEVRLELAEAERRIDRHRDDAGANGAEETENEVFVLREDESDSIPFAQADRLKRAAVTRARALDRRVGKRRLALRGRAARPGHPLLGDKPEAARRVAFGSVFDGLRKCAGERRGRTL